MGCGCSEIRIHMHSAIEQRKAIRYQLRSPVLFMWAPQNGKPRSGRGVTRDINTFGVYVETDAIPPVGARVQMEIVLPKVAESSNRMQLHGEGVVLRCDRGRAHQCGFAASAQVHPETADVVLSQLKVSWPVV
jgi:hypothetical protein